MQLFYLENPKNEIILSAEESKHATKALRKKEGDILNFTDGKKNTVIGWLWDKDGPKNNVCFQNVHFSVAPVWDWVCISSR